MDNKEEEIIIQMRDEIYSKVMEFRFWNKSDEIYASLKEALDTAYHMGREVEKRREKSS